MDPRDRDDVSRTAGRLSAPSSPAGAQGVSFAANAAESKPRLGFIGAGRVGCALSSGLASAGYPVAAAASRRFASAERLAASVPGCRAVAGPQAVADAVDLVFITTPDEAIAGVAASVCWRPGQWVVHTSGAESVGALSAARDAGALVGGLHPLQAFADAEQAAARLAGSTFALEGEGPLLGCLKAMAEALGGRWLVPRAEQKALYHAAAVFASNYVVALAGAAADLWRLLGVERPAALRALLPLLRGAVDNLDALGLPQALTGPIARGDAATVARHLAALGEASPGLLPAYRELALLAVPIAIARGLSEEDAAVLRELLQQPVDSSAPPIAQEVSRP